MTGRPVEAPLGVVVVTYNAADVVLDCLESLLGTQDAELHIVVVDNASTDGTAQLIRDWAAGRVSHELPKHLPFAVTRSPKPLELREPDDPGAGITLIEAGANGGFAAGVNRGLAHLARSPDIDRFWILNPDSVVPQETPGILARHPAPPDGFSLMGGRIKYLDPPHRIQSDGGRFSRLTGVTGNIHLGQPGDTPPPPDASGMDFICGASMVASRAFYEAAGPLPEEYFLYYEEVAWAAQRGQLPLLYCPEALIYHQAGSSIGSPTISRMASPFSIYFMFRARTIFIRRHFPLSLPITYGYAFAKAMQILLKGHTAEAAALLRAIHGLGPPAAVRARLAAGPARAAASRPGADHAAAAHLATQGSPMSSRATTRR